MIYLHQILPYLIYPLTFVLILLVASLLTRSKIPVILSLIILLVSTSPIISEIFTRQLEANQIRKQPIDIANADAVVVLSGMIRSTQSLHGLIYEWSDPDRFFAGLELFKAKKAPYIIFTGARLPWDPGSQSEGKVLANFAQEFGVPKDKILLSESAQNTHEEAIAINKLLRKFGLKKIILVTSAFHMSRAQQIFDRENIELQTYPVDSRIGASQFTFMELIPSSSAMAGLDFALREFLGRAYYALHPN